MIISRFVSLFLFFYFFQLKPPASHPSLPPINQPLHEFRDMNAQISERLECIISTYAVQADDHGKIHEKVWPSFQQRSMDLVNLAVCESKAV